MKQFGFNYSSIQDALDGIADICRVLDSFSHGDAAAFVFIDAFSMADVASLVSQYDVSLPDVKRVGISEGFSIGGALAVEVYRKYLGVEWDEYFVLNVCEFPLMVRRDGVDICLVPVDSRNGGLTLSGTVEENEKLRFSYSTKEAIFRADHAGDDR